ncbi:hypothetical protein Tco_0879191 [Tanacetum coccineum]
MGLLSSACYPSLRQVVLDGGTNFPVALHRQDGVTAKLKIENPSLDTSIRQDGVTAKLKTENPSLDTSISASLEINLDAKALMLAINQSPIGVGVVWNGQLNHVVEKARENHHDGTDNGSTHLEIPGRLYMFVRQALDLDKQLLQTSNTLEDLRSELKDNVARDKFKGFQMLIVYASSYCTIMCEPVYSIRIQQVVSDGGTNFPVALDRQDRVTAKLKTENPSLDTSIRQDGVTAKLRTRNSSLDTSISASLERNLDAKALMCDNRGSSRQDGVTAKLKIENPSLDTSIRQDGVTAKLKTENPSLDTSIRILYLNKVTNEGITKKSLESSKVSQRKDDYLFKLRSVAPKITINPVTEKFQRLQTLIISSHKWLRCQAYRTKCLSQFIDVNPMYMFFTFSEPVYSILSGSTQLEIPGRLYMFVQQALDLDKQLLQTSNSLEDLRSELKDVNLIIADFT